MSEAWHQKTLLDSFTSLQSSEQGLSPEEAARRLGEHGPNTLPKENREGLLIIFLRQFQSPLIYVLFLAAVLVFFIGEPVDAAIIVGVLLFNAVVGTIQEGRAARTLLALRNFAQSTVTVSRGGEELLIPDSELVVGDILVLSEGERVGADARLILSNTLKVDEAALTGESTPVHKVTEALPQKGLPASEQKNMVFKGTYVLSGNGRAIVVATGVRTLLGSIAQKIAHLDSEIPLRRDIRALSHAIIGVVLLLCSGLFLFGLARGESAVDMFSTVVALAVSVIPEGLPIVITLVLATGVWRMSKRHALVKKLQAVEALGQARVIAVDKTGTITKNELMVERVVVAGSDFKIGGVGYESKGDVYRSGEVVEPAAHPELLFVGKIAAYCANARVVYSHSEKRHRVVGDPTEAAMLVFAEKLGFHKEVLERESPLILDVPFDYHLKFHLTRHEERGGKFLTAVGAPESILMRSSTLWRPSHREPLGSHSRARLEEEIVALSKSGLRVVGIAYSDFGGEVDAEHLPPLTFVGFFGMKDALRPEVGAAMAQAKGAGVRVVMITGDHRGTAEALAKEAGIFKEGDSVLTGQDLERLSVEQLSATLANVSVFARVTPEHKLRIIEAYKRRGEVVAMTGDGVNDAPSLVAADLGVAMGGIGTEVAREASDIVLLDDNFGSIISAIEEGRHMYQAIKKVVLYLFSTSAGEVATIVGALVLTLPLPLLPAQIIWLNFVTDPFLDVALGLEPKDKKLLSGSYKKPKKYLLDGAMVFRMALMALAMAFGTLLLFAAYAGEDMAKALTLSLTTLAVFQWFNAWNCRSETLSFFAQNPLHSPYLLLATATVIALQLLAVYHPLLQSVLHTTPLSLSEWLLIIPIALSIVLVEEIRKAFARIRRSP